MGKKAGALLWARKRFTVPAATEFVPGEITIDTGLMQPNTGFGDYSPDEPGLDAAGMIGSRIQVVPMVPTSKWSTITHQEPYVDPATGTVKVKFLNTGGAVAINALFWDPHSIVGPGAADRYLPAV